MAYSTNVPLLANVVADDLTAINANWEYLILTDGTANRTIHRCGLAISDGTDASTIRCLFSGSGTYGVPPEIAFVDNIAKDATTGTYYALNAAGTILTINTSLTTPKAIAVIGIDINTNTTTVAANVNAYVSSTDLLVSVYDSTDGSLQDLTAIVGASKGLTLYMSCIWDG